MDLPNAACHFVADTIQLSLTEMVRYKPTEVMDLAARSEEKFNNLFSMREGLGKETRSTKWKRLVSGELPLAKAVELADRLLSD
jgi:hypothetical protein